jgi:hypothetical protein
VLDRLYGAGYGRGELGAVGWGRASSHAAESIKTKRESACMSESRADIDQGDSEIRKTVLACLRQRERRALFVTELATALRKAHGVSASGVERALAVLESDWSVVIRDHYCADPHVVGADLRIVALVEPGAGDDGQMQAIHEVEATWHEWLAEYMANHRCT